MTKGQLTLRIVAGGYLAYLGFGLARDAITKQMDNYVIFLTVGVIFMALGGVWCIQALRKYVRHDYEDVWKEAESREEEQDRQETAIAAESQAEEEVIEMSSMEDTISSEQESIGKEE